MSQSPRSISQWMSSPSNQSLLWAILVSFLLFSIAFIVFHPHPDADKLSREPRTIEIMNVNLSSNRKFRAARISYDASQLLTMLHWSSPVSLQVPVFNPFPSVMGAARSISVSHGLLSCSLASM
ncbi:unnamed protein product [Closterium sp. NIES-65]|nr:unnamed protein product [Closterium sp. NIES-65]